MFAQKTVWSSGELSDTPSNVILILLPAAPRMRIAAVPVPSPFSPQANTPGVCERRKGSSRPLLENASSSVFLILETAYGALFGKHPLVSILKTDAKVILSYQTTKSNLYKYRMRVFIFLSSYIESDNYSLTSETITFLTI